MSATPAPRRASSHAAAAPITPAPIIAMSHSRITSQDSITARDVTIHQSCVYGVRRPVAALVVFHHAASRDYHSAARSAHSTGCRPQTQLQTALVVALHCLKGAAVAAHVFAEDAVPGRNDDRDRAESLRLAGKANQRLRLIGVNVTELLDAPAFERRDFRKLLSAA